LPEVVIVGEPVVDDAASEVKTLKTTTPEPPAPLLPAVFVE
jgi:hypothetical protein